jgi:hypothetical protein
MNSTDIANLALGRLGVGQAIANLNEQSTPAKLCRRFYDYCRQEVLRSHPWGFASSWITLAQVADQTFPGWSYVYAYPANALMVWSVADESGVRSSWTSDLYCSDVLTGMRRRYPFKVALKDDLASRVLLSDTSSAYAFLTYDVTNTGTFPVDFAGVLASRLAMEVGGPLQAKVDLIQNARGEFLYWKSHATSMDMTEQAPDRQPDSESITCRS